MRLTPCLSWEVQDFNALSCVTSAPLPALHGLGEVGELFLMEEHLGLWCTAWGPQHRRELILRSPLPIPACWLPVFVVPCPCSVICQCLASPGLARTLFLSAAIGFVLSVPFGAGEEQEEHPLAIHS